jgi:hypothetical protein
VLSVKIIFDAIAITGVFAAHDHLSAHRIGVAGGEGVLAVGLLKAAAHPVDAHLPELGGDCLVNLLVVDALHLGLQISTHFESALHALVALLPHTTAAVTRKARSPGVAVVVSSAERGGAIAAGGEHSRAGGNGHGSQADGFRLRG